MHRAWIEKPLLLLLSVAALPAAVAAQELRGIVVDRITQQPVAHAAVYLLDNGRVESRRLTDAAGWFAVPVAVGRTYRVRIEQLGFEAFVSEPVRLDTAEARPVRFEIETRAIVVPALAVEAGNRGCSIEEGGPLLHALWTEARKALAASQLTEEQRLLRFQGVLYTRRLDARGDRVVSQTARPFSGRSPRPFQSLPAADLSERGYIRRVEGSTDFSVFAPDAAVLLSPEFLGDHCFSLVEGEPASRQIGLRFEPVEGRRPDYVDVEGTFWLHASNFQLQRLELRYVGSLANQPFDDARGRVEFTAAPNGAWLISRWWIRVPLFEAGRLRFGGGSARNVRVSGIHEDGGYIERFSAGNAIFEVLAAGSLDGRVLDGLSGRPLAGALVRLNGTNYRVMTDDDGRFTMPGVYPGTYSIAYHHPSVDSLPPLERAAVAVTIESQATTSVDVVGPSLRDIRQAACPTDDETEHAMLWGRVLNAGDRTPVADAKVTLRWDSVFTAGAGLGARKMQQAMLTDAQGRYVFCGVPAQVRIWLSAASASGRSDEQSLVIRSSYFVRDVLLDAGQPNQERAISISDRIASWSASAESKRAIPRMR